MKIANNIIKEYLKNVYFIAGTPCGGKTTIARALGEKYNIPVYDVDEAKKYTEPSRLAFLIKEPNNLVEEYCDRPDHQGFSDFIHSATDYERAKHTCNETLRSLNEEHYNAIKQSEFFWLERDNNRNVRETVSLVEQYWGWNMVEAY